MAVPAHVEREDLQEIVEQVVVGDKLFLAVSVREESDSVDSPGDLFEMGTTCAIVQMVRMPDDSLRFLAQGLQRSKIQSMSQANDHYVAEVDHISEEESESAAVEALMRNIREQFVEFVDMMPNTGDDIVTLLNEIENGGRLADLVAANLDISLTEKQEVLEILDPRERLERVGVLLAQEMEYLGIAQKIQSEARDKMDESQREYWLRQQMKAIQDELGEGKGPGAQVEEIREQLEEKELPQEAQEAAEHELGRLEAINPASPEYSVVRTYLDWILELPWLQSTPDKLDLQKARDVLDEDHFGLEDVKERVLEFLAVRKLREDMRGSIMCFLGPPGTGKTSIGKSIARALGREYVRSSLGGVHDEAEIRGHRRTYVGALPGQIILGMKKAGSNNPVFMLDEVDKLGADFRGDPASALLEALDPEQNDEYVDHYLDLSFDLSKVMFICTANVPDTIPPALRDRMEILEFPGYTEEEKLQIALKYLVPKQIEDHGLTEDNIEISEEALNRVISEYTREAGVRNLEREIASLCRKVAVKVVKEEAKSQKVGEKTVEDMLGPPQYIPEVAERVDEPGVATGVAWTATGGTVIFVEASRIPGEGNYTLTGQLGDVMKESAHAALTYAKSHCDELDIDPEIFKKHDFHIHVPAGAIPKDGPSAGITMATALLSLCMERLVRYDVAMTGEITLRGKVLPVGGIKEKAIAAKTAGIETLVLPKKNEKDLRDIPEYARESLDFVFAETMSDVLSVALRESNDQTLKPREAAAAGSSE
ncbi:MAG: endopeptidase La [Planctomycetes bacterium]|nr:endopeptidase La [Planctomycetota bacterium]